MNPFYDRAADNALRMIAAKGLVLPIKRYALADSDPASGACQPVVENQGLLTAIIMTGAGNDASAAIRLTDGLVEDRRLELLAAAKNAPFEPRPLDELEYDGLRWLVRAVTVAAPDGTPLIYRLISVVKQ